MMGLARKKEAVVLKEILSYLKDRPGKFWRQNTGALPLTYKGKTRFVKFGVAGAADITGITARGVRVEIEVKAQGKKREQSEAQKSFEWMINENLGIYVLADSVRDVMEAGL